jgi:hypothetical protein
MASSLDASQSYHVRISPLHVRLKCDVPGCWTLARTGLEFADAAGRPVEHRAVCIRHSDEEVEKVKSIVALTIHDERAGRITGSRFRPQGPSR